MSGFDGNFELPVSIFHVFENLRQFVQSDFSGYEIPGADIAARDQVHSFTYESRRVVETGFYGYFGVMQRRGFELDLRSTRASTEKIDRSAAANHLQGPLPCGR